MRGRPEGWWGEQIGLEIDPLQRGSGRRGRITLKARSLEEVLDTLVLAGFSGIYLDRRGLRDEGLMVVPRLQMLLLTTPIEDSDRHLVFFNLSRYAQTLRAKTTPEDWEAAKRQALELPSEKTAR